MSILHEIFDPEYEKTSRLKVVCQIVLLDLVFAILFLWGITEAYAAWQLQAKGIATQGIVVRLNEERFGEGACCVYRPAIRFKVDNQVYTCNSIWASDPPDYQMGEQVNIRYNPANPSRARIDNFSEHWAIPITTSLRQFLPHWSPTLLCFASGNLPKVTKGEVFFSARLSFTIHSVAKLKNKKGR